MPSCGAMGDGHPVTAPNLLLVVSPMWFGRVKRYHRAVDVIAREQRRGKRHYTVPCERCHRRITWYTLGQVEAFKAGVGQSMFQWQGRRAPIRERLDAEGRSLFDIECFHCGWRRTYSDDALLSHVVKNYSLGAVIRFGVKKP